MTVEDELLKRFGAGRAAIIIDYGIVVSVGVDELNLCAEFFENCGANDAGGAVGAI